MDERQYLAGDVFTLVVQFDVGSGRGVGGVAVGSAPLALTRPIDSVLWFVT